jgi:hypothetical protein
MTLLAEPPAAHDDQSAYHGPGDAVPGPAIVSGPDHPADPPGVARDRARTIRSWPLLLLFLLKHPDQAVTRAPYVDPAAAVHDGIRGGRRLRLRHAPRAPP